MNPITFVCRDGRYTYENNPTKTPYFNKLIIALDCTTEALRIIFNYCATGIITVSRRKLLLDVIETAHLFKMTGLISYSDILLANYLKRGPMTFRVYSNAYKYKLYATICTIKNDNVITKSLRRFPYKVVHDYGKSNPVVFKRWITDNEITDRAKHTYDFLTDRRTISANYIKGSIGNNILELIIALQSSYDVNKLISLYTTIMIAG